MRRRISEYQEDKIRISGRGREYMRMRRISGCHEDEDEEQNDEEKIKRMRRIR